MNTTDTRYKFRKITDLRPIYDYYCSVKNTVPYWLNAEFELWMDSYAADSDYDGEMMFRELITYSAVCDGEIVGFIQ